MLESLRLQRALMAAPLVCGAALCVVALVGACADDSAPAAATTDGGAGPETQPDAGDAGDSGAAAAVCAPAMPNEGVFPDPTCPIHKPAQPDTFDQALASVGLDRCTLG